LLRMPLEHTCMHEAVDGETLGDPVKAGRCKKRRLALGPEPMAIEAGLCSDTAWHVRCA
jgi:hypothetical protein